MKKYKNIVYSILTAIVVIGLVLASSGILDAYAFESTVGMVSFLAFYFLIVLRAIWAEIGQGIFYKILAVLIPIILIFIYIGGVMVGQELDKQIEQNNTSSNNN